MNVDRDVSRESEAQYDHDREAERVTISEIEVEPPIKTMRKRKADGGCGIPPELLNYGGVDMRREMTKTFNAVFDLEKVPEEWEERYISLFSRKGQQVGR